MKTTKIISYDLKKPHRNYDAVLEYISKYKTFAHITQSTYLISTDKTCKEITDEFGYILDSDDRCIVVELSGRPFIANPIDDFKMISKDLLI